MTIIKNDRIYVRVNDEIKKDFEATAAYLGLKTSALLHSLIVKIIHEQRKLTPQIFRRNADENRSEEFGSGKNTPPSRSNFTNDRTGDRTEQSPTKLFIGNSEIPLIDEAESAASERDEQ